MFDWCVKNQHKACRRFYKRFYFDSKGKFVQTDEEVHCNCSCHKKKT
jgi:hypothetical protein